MKMQVTWRRAAAFLGSMLLTLGAGTAQAQSAYPNKPITVIAPYSAGGDSDLAARTFAAAAQRLLGVPVIVVNKPGASGVIGSAQVISSPADGYTLLLARPGSQSILPAIMPTRTKYKWDDYTMVGLLELNPYGCMTRAAKYKTFDEFATALRSKGKEMNFGTAGVLTTNDMGPRQLFRLVKLGDKVPTQIPYKGTGEATSALLAGDIDFACGSIGSFLPHIKQGTLRALMVTTPERLAVLPDTPTAAELGYAEMGRVIGWSGIYGPPGMSADVVARLNQMMRSLAQHAAWVKATEQAGSIPYVRGADETREFARAQFQMYQALGESLNIIDKGD